MARRSFATTGRARLAWSMFALTVLFLIAMVVLSAGREDPFDTILYGLLALSTGGVAHLLGLDRGARRVGAGLSALSRRTPAQARCAPCPRERRGSNGFLDEFTRKTMDVSASGICDSKELLLEGASHPGLIAVG